MVLVWEVTRKLRAATYLYEVKIKTKKNQKIVITQILTMKLPGVESDLEALLFTVKN